MHIVLDSEYGEMSDLDIRAHEALLDRLLYHHLSQEHLFCLTPANIIALRRAIQFGPQASRALDIIRRRFQDYGASLRASPHRLVLMAMGQQQAKLPVGGSYFVRPEDAHLWLSTKPSLFVENGSSDGAIFKFLINAGVAAIGSSSDLVSINIVHGGGNTLADVIEDTASRFTVGMCICDKDSVAAVPPFPEGSTGRRAHDALINVGMLAAGDNSLSACHPFFSFVATLGWGLENYVGPHALEVFFEQAPECVESRQKFLAAFPTFPVLDDVQAREWILINLKSAAQSVEDLLSEAGSSIAEAGINHARASQLAALTIPDSVIPFIRQASRASRHHRALMKAISADFAAAWYSDGVTSLAQRALAIFAADSRIDFA